MKVAELHPYHQFNFLVDFGAGEGSVAHAGFQECTGLGSENDLAVERGTEHAKSHITKITGINKSTDVTLKRGVISAPDLNVWLDEVRGDSNARRDVIITLQSEDRRKPPKIWKLRRARIIKHTSGPVNAKGTDVPIEELTLSCERIEP